MKRFTERFPALFQQPVGFLIVGLDDSVTVVREVVEIVQIGRLPPLSLSTVEDALLVNHPMIPFKQFYGLFEHCPPGGDATPAVFIERLVDGFVHGNWYGNANASDPNDLDVRQMDPQSTFLPLYTGFELPPPQFKV